MSTMMDTKGRMPYRKVRIFFGPHTVIMLAKHNMTENLAISEGWNSTPIFSQRWASLCSTPTKITATKSKTETTMEGMAR